MFLLQKYNSQMIFSPSELEAKINSAINELDYNKNPRSLFEPIEYILSIGEKIETYLSFYGYQSIY